MLKRLSNFFVIIFFGFGLPACVSGPASQKVSIQASAQGDKPAASQISAEFNENAIPELLGVVNAEEVQNLGAVGSSTECKIIDGRDHCVEYGYSFNAVSVPKQAAPFQVEIISSEKKPRVIG